MGRQHSKSNLLKKNKRFKKKLKTSKFGEAETYSEPFHLYSVESGLQENASPLSLSLSLSLHHDGGVKVNKGCTENQHR